MIYKYDTDPEVVVSNMVEIDFVDGDEQGFPKVKETLERIGIASNRTKTLYQSAHVLHKAGRYYICHFMEMFALDGRSVTMSEEDVARRNFIVKLLTDWELIRPLTDNYKHPMGVPRMVKILKHGEKSEWTLSKKYSIGYKDDYNQ
jgi:hypothetical protein